MEGSLLGGLVQLVNLVRDLGTAGYKAKAAWKDFERKVEMQRTRSDMWTDLESSYGPDLLGPLKTSVEVAKKLLDLEINKKSKRKYKIWFAQHLLFPGTLEQAIDNVINAFDAVIHRLREFDELPLLVQNNWMRREEPPLEFQSDERYVRLEMTEREVERSLCTSEINVVLLQGGSGTGKTSLARNLVLRIRSRGKFRQDERLVDSSTSEHVQHFSSTSTPGAVEADSHQLHEAFLKAVLLNCGPKGEFEILQRDLLNRIGWQNVGATSDEQLSRAVVNYLRHKKLLVVLDDVWHNYLLQGMLSLAAEATSVKFLVTSQDPHICDGLNSRYIYKMVHMEVISLADARKILSRHIFDPNSDRQRRFEALPDNGRIQKCADKIIEMVDKNIFALACVGGAARLDRENFGKLTAWEGIVQDLHGYLRCDNRAAMVHSVKYRHENCFAAIQYSLARLTESEKKLLVLVSWCEETFVPETIVQYLYKMSGTWSDAAWEVSKRDLVSKSLLRTEGGSCSIHSLLRTCLEQDLQEECERYKRLFAENLAKNDTLRADTGEYLVASAICLLFFKDRTFAIGIADNLKAPAHFLDAKHSRFIKLVAAQALGSTNLSAAECSNLKTVLLKETFLPALLHRQTTSGWWDKIPESIRVFTLGVALGRLIGLHLSFFLILATKPYAIPASNLLFFEPNKSLTWFIVLYLCLSFTVAMLEALFGYIRLQRWGRGSPTLRRAIFYLWKCTFDMIGANYITALLTFNATVYLFYKNSVKKPSCACGYLLSVALSYIEMMMPPVSMYNCILYRTVLVRDELDCRKQQYRSFLVRGHTTAFKATRKFHDELETELTHISQGLAKVRKSLDSNYNIFFLGGRFYSLVKKRLRDTRSSKAKVD